MTHKKMHTGHDNSCPSCAKKEKPWYRERFWQVIVFVAVVLTLSYFFTPLNPLFHAFVHYASLLWWAILLGIVLGGIIDYFIPNEYISKYLAGGKKRTILYATGFGFMMSSCSHGILAISMELYKKGASTPAVIAFLLAAPWANLTITIMLLAFFGLKALLIIFFAIVIAITTGLIFQLLDRKGMVERNRQIRIKKGFSIKKDLRRRWAEYDMTAANVKKEARGVARGMWGLSKMILWWILIGMLAAAAAEAFIPTDFFQQYLGATILGLLATLLLATVIEVCSEGSAPMAFEIFRQTGAFGNSFVFLMAGVATDYTEIGLIWSNIGKRAALWLPVVTIPQIVVLGYLFNLLV